MTCSSNNDKWRSFSAIVFPPLRYNSPTITLYKRTSAVVSVTSSNRHISRTIYQKKNRVLGADITKQFNFFQQNGGISITFQIIVT